MRGWSSRNPSAARPAAMPGCSTRRGGHAEVAYYADDFVVLHEAAHAWFNGNLLADRWALEAFASYYALEAAADLKVKAKGDELTDELRKSKIPLNAWGPIGREERGTEDYAYAATLEVARQIAERAGEEGLQEVWQAAADKAGAYQPPASTGAATAGTSGAGGGSPQPSPSASRPARLARPARPARGAHGPDLRRPVARVDHPARGRAAPRRARRGPQALRRRRRRGRGMVAAAPDPRRDARLAVRHGRRAA